MDEGATDAGTPDGSYTASFGGMASDAARATRAYADVTREKVATEGKIVDQMTARGEEDRARAVKAFDEQGIKPEEFKPWNYEQEKKRFEGNPIEGFGSTGGLFAMIASAFTKAPMLSAMEGMAGALNGIKQGKEEDYTRAYKAWQDNTKLAKERHDLQHRIYQDALALGSHDLQLSQAKLRAEAARFGDKQVLALAENGMVKEIFDTINSRNRAMESAAELAERTTIRDMQKRYLTQAYQEIDAQQGVPDAVKAAQKLKLFNTTMTSGKLGTPQQTMLAQIMMENPTMPVDDVLKKAEAAGIIKPTGGAGGNSAAATRLRIITERAKELQAENPGLSMTEAMGKAETEAKPESKTAPAMKQRMINSRAQELRQADPELSESQAQARAARELNIESSAPSGNRIDDIRRNVDLADSAITKSEKILDFLEKYKGGAGLVGKIMRGEEIAENIAGISTQTDRAQMRRHVLELQEVVGKLLTDQSGRPLKSAQDKVDAVVAGLASGDTGPNTRRAYRELIQELRDRQKKWRERIMVPANEAADPDRETSSAPAVAPPTGGKKPPPANWLDAYPKK